MKKILLTQILLVNFIFSYSQNQSEKNTKISGIVYSEYFCNVQRDTNFQSITNKVATGEENVHGIAIKRIYFTYDNKISSKLFSRFRLETDDANFTSNTKSQANKFGVFIKDAYLKINYFGQHSLIVGIQPTPAYEIAEKIWGYRFVEKTILDWRGIVSSRDMGVALDGSIDTLGKFKYTILYGNGAASTPEKDKYKKFYGSLNINPVSNFFLTIYSDYQFKSSIINKYDSTKSLNNDSYIVGGFIGYKVPDKYMIGIESYFIQLMNFYDNGTVLSNQNGLVFSAYGSLNISKPFAFYGRFDYYEPNTNKNAKGDKRNSIIAGLSYKTFDKLYISPNVFIETYEKKNGVQPKSSLTYRLSISYDF